MNNIVGVKELRENLPAYIKEVGRGRSFTVVRRSRPVFTISPPLAEEGAWEEVLDFTKVQKGGVSLSELLSRL